MAWEHPLIIPVVHSIGNTCAILASNDETSWQLIAASSSLHLCAVELQVTRATSDYPEAAEEHECTCVA
mgnify:CR=1 FL=1|jgi:hypothetical protein